MRELTDFPAKSRSIYNLARYFIVNPYHNDENKQ
jgi:hypothetical protein